MRIIAIFDFRYSIFEIRFFMIACDFGRTDLSIIRKIRFCNIVTFSFCHFPIKRFLCVYFLCMREPNTPIGTGPDSFFRYLEFSRMDYAKDIKPLICAENWLAWKDRIFEIYNALDIENRRIKVLKRVGAHRTLVIAHLVFGWAVSGGCSAGKMPFRGASLQTAIDFLTLLKMIYNI